jgi:hypothetical protein
MALAGLPGALESPARAQGKDARTAAMSKGEHEVRLPDRFWRHFTHLSLDAKGMYSILLTFIDCRTCETHVGNDRFERPNAMRRSSAWFAEKRNFGGFEKSIVLSKVLMSVRIHLT